GAEDLAGVGEPARLTVWLDERRRVWRLVPLPVSPGRPEGPRGGQQDAPAGGVVPLRSPRQRRRDFHAAAAAPAGVADLPQPELSAGETGGECVADEPDASAVPPPCVRGRGAADARWPPRARAIAPSPELDAPAAAPHGVRRRGGASDHRVRAART